MQRVGEPSREMGQWRDGGWHESAQCKEGREVMLTYALNRTARESLYEQLYRALRLDIESGALGAGDRLPSKRAFAKHLGVSVVTVEGAYDQLVAEGYVRAVPRSGFYVQEIGPNLTSFSRISTSVEVKVPLGDSSGAKSASCRPEARISGNDGVEKLEKLARFGGARQHGCNNGDAKRWARTGEVRARSSWRWAAIPEQRVCFSAPPQNATYDKQRKNNCRYSLMMTLSA